MKTVSYLIGIFCLTLNLKTAAPLKPSNRTADTLDMETKKWIHDLSNALVIVAGMVHSAKKQLSAETPNRTLALEKLEKPKRVLRH